MAADALVLKVREGGRVVNVHALGVLNRPGFDAHPLGGKVGRIMPKTYDESTKSKAVRLVVEHREEYESEYACIRVVAGRIGVGPETLRKWVWRVPITESNRSVPVL